jgi:putative ABC transport system permease protein
VKYLPLVWKNLWRRKIRTIFTLACIFIAFLLFGMLMTIRAAFSLGVELAGMDRLVLIHKVSLIMPLPVSYQGRIKAVEGVTDATHQSWFGGIYQDPSNFFAQIAVEPEPFLKMYPEFRLPTDQQKAWLADRQGAIAGRDLADRFGWKVGDRIPLQGTIWRPRSGTGDTWEFNLVGSTTASAVSTRRSSFSDTTTSTKIASSARAWSGGTSSRWTTPHARSNWPGRSTRCSRIHRKRPRPRRRKGSWKASPRRSAISARS